jgi:virginiamycin A acetyltransferase
MKKLIKLAVQAISLAMVFPMALLCLFGRVDALYVLGAQLYALFPGLIGDYLRIAYCRLTLEECSLDSRLQFGSFFAHPQAKIARGVYIGSHCVLGRTHIGERTQIASGVQILSGRRQHDRDAEGQILGGETGIFETVTIGADCWIGAAAIIMADVGAGTTIGAGSVVTKPVPARSVAVGNPARVIKSE